ncbi:MAG: glycosyltransferase [Sphingomonadaceae bacterium]
MKILHCHSTFSLGGKEARAVRLMNAFGNAAQHTILTAAPGALGARDAIDTDVQVDFPCDAPLLTGKPSPTRYRRLTTYMKQFDLVLSYNWGSMDAVGARRLFPRGCPPLIHHEDGFNQDESETLNWKRSLFRRLMFPSAKHVIVPSQRLETIVRDVWKYRAVVRIPNGIDVAAYTASPAPDAIPGFVRGDGDVIIGTLAGLRAVKNVPRLVRAVAGLPPHCRLVIVGEGPEKGAIAAEADRLGISDRVFLAGFLPSPHRYIGLFDIFALSSDSEQFPISLIEAMAAGVAAVSTDVGDVRQILPPAARAFVVPVADEAGYHAALAKLAGDMTLRKALGRANRALAAGSYDEAAMIARYAALYGIGGHA